MSKALAIKYRPNSFSDLTEQESIKKILSYQIQTKTIKNGYLFTGPAGCGKTTSARIFADMINEHKGFPIELDAASNNSVDDIRQICEQAQTKALDSEYKVFILDEVHVLSSQAWQAMLKTLEEPPAKSVFILCTTNPEKIPATILSRVQRYNFQRIGLKGIEDRLFTILEAENAEIQSNGSQDAVADIEWAIREGLPIIDWEATAVSLIAKLANGGMREAITLMDKCLSYSKDLTECNVIKALGVANYSVMFGLNDAIISSDLKEVFNIVNSIYAEGIDLKQFMKTYFEFLLDIEKYYVLKNFDSIKIPSSYSQKLSSYSDNQKVTDTMLPLLKLVMQLNSDLKWEKNPKDLIEASLAVFVLEV